MTLSSSPPVMLTSAQRRRNVLILLGLLVVSLLGLLLLPPIPQDQSYHLFADRRTLLGVPNFWNVVSNLPFIAVGAAGLWHVRGDGQRADHHETHSSYHASTRWCTRHTMGNGVPPSRARPARPASVA